MLCLHFRNTTRTDRCWLLAFLPVLLLASSLYFGVSCCYCRHHCDRLHLSDAAALAATAAAVAGNDERSSSSNKLQFPQRELSAMWNRDMAPTRRLFSSSLDILFRLAVVMRPLPPAASPHTHTHPTFPCG